MMDVADQASKNKTNRIFEANWHTASEIFLLDF